MGLGTYEQQVIKALAENDVREAKKWALLALDAIGLRSIPHCGIIRVSACKEYRGLERKML